jgi:uncharacterized membrane protein
MAYFISIAVLAATVAGFFLLARGQFRRPVKLQWLLGLLAALPLVLSSVMHFIRTAAFASIIPPGFPAPPLLVRISGVLEFAGAIGLTLPATRRAASTCLALMMIAVFPANVYAADRVVGGLHMPSVPVRAALQILYILFLLVAGWGIPVYSFPGRREQRSL